ncbi:unnamed protein product [Amoebophrya sp. A25]|nr:unnamed protein product [Amoebophrya sp. A25]|eukprot:GSA25T00016318001.1
MMGKGNNMVPQDKDDMALRCNAAAVSADGCTTNCACAHAFVEPRLHKVNLQSDLPSDGEAQFGLHTPSPTTSAKKAALNHENDLPDGFSQAMASHSRCHEIPASEFGHRVTPSPTTPAKRTALNHQNEPGHGNNVDKKQLSVTDTTTTSAPLTHVALSNKVDNLALGNKGNAGVALMGPDGFGQAVTNPVTEVTEMAVTEVLDYEDFHGGWRTYARQLRSLLCCFVTTGLLLAFGFVPPMGWPIFEYDLRGFEEQSTRSASYSRQPCYSFLASLAYLAAGGVVSALGILLGTTSVYLWVGIYTCTASSSAAASATYANQICLVLVVLFHLLLLETFGRMVVAVPDLQYVLWLLHAAPMLLSNAGAGVWFHTSCVVALRVPQHLSLMATEVCTKFGCVSVPSSSGAATSVLSLGMPLGSSSAMAERQPLAFCATSPRQLSGAAPAISALLSGAILLPLQRGTTSPLPALLLGAISLRPQRGTTSPQPALLSGAI